MTAPLVMVVVPAITALVGLLMLWLVRGALALVWLLDRRIMGSRFADLISASPVRIFFGAAELVDPGQALGLAGVLAAASTLLVFSCFLGVVAAHLGGSGLLLSYGMDLPGRLRAGASDPR